MKEAEKLLNCADSIQKMPSLSSTETQTRYLVAAKDCRRQMYECKVHRDHVVCACPCFKYNGLCKHSLRVAETVNLLKEHIEFLKRSPRFHRPTKSSLVEPQKEAAGDLAVRTTRRATAGLTSPPHTHTVLSITTAGLSLCVSFLKSLKRLNVGSVVPSSLEGKW